MVGLEVHLAAREDLLARELDLPLVRREQSCEHASQGRLARTVGPEDAEPLAAAHVERDVVQRLDVAVVEEGDVRHVRHESRPCRPARYSQHRHLRPSYRMPC